MGDGYTFDNNGFDWDVLMEAACFSRRFADLAYDIHARGYFAENGIAVALRGFVFEVEECVVGSIDEELAGGGIRIAGTRHGADGVFQAVVRFVVDGFVCGFLGKVCGKAAALNHKAVDHAVENGVVVKAFARVADEVGDGFGRFGFVERQVDVAHIGFDDGACLGLGVEGCGKREGGESEFEGFVHRSVSRSVKIKPYYRGFYVKSLKGVVKKFKVV